MDDWRTPYRSMDASGSPESAAQVGWDWLLPIVRAEHARDPRGLELDHPRAGSDSRATCLYRNCRLIAAAVVIRDPMNFAVLIRWKAEGTADG